MNEKRFTHLDSMVWAYDMIHYVVGVKIYRSKNLMTPSIKKLSFMINYNSCTLQLKLPNS